MKKIMFLAILLAAMTACKSGGEPAELDEATPNSNAADSNLLLGEWKINEMYRTTHLYGKEKTDTVAPNVSWRFADDGFYYETVHHEGNEDTYQYGYVLHGDSIMLREETEYDEPWWTAWWIIDTLSQERLVLMADDTDMVLRVTLQKNNTDK